ncbi:MAG: hypothetical protein JW810_12230 [Sedimentisphaerales bacterium]|nr:hypothetical protein [Sedimentisphaerales bacterium]
MKIMKTRFLILAFSGLFLLASAPTARALFVRDDFNDKPANDLLRYKAGGIGWRTPGAWSQDESGAQGGTNSILVYADELELPAGSGYGLTQTGIDKVVRGTGTNARQDVRAVGDPNLVGTVWFSFLVRNESSGSRGGITLNNAVTSYNPVDPRITSAGHQFKLLLSGVGGTDVTVDNVFAAGRTSLVVGRIDIDDAGGNERVRVWVDPVLTSLGAPLADVADANFGMNIHSVGVMTYYSGSSPAGSLDMLVLSDAANGRWEVTGFSGAYDPSPYHGESDVTNEFDNRQLTWNVSLNPDDPGQVDPNVTAHYVYLSSGSPTDPNLPSAPTATIARSGDNAAWNPAGGDELQLGGSYWWRVDQAIQGSAYDSADTRRGAVWHFTMAPPQPLINLDPVGALVDPGADPNFAVAATNPETGDQSNLEYRWYRRADGVEEALSDGAKYAGTATNHLWITDAAGGDEGAYFCRVNIAGSVNASSDSGSANLAVRRLVAHWTMDGDLLDGSGNGWNGVFKNNDLPDPNLGLPTYVAGLVGSQALAIEPNDCVFVGDRDHPLSPAQYSGQLSITCWVNWKGLTDTYQGLVAKRNDDWATETAWQIRTELAGGTLRYLSPSAGDGPAMTLEDDGEWELVAVAVNAGGSTFYTVQPNQTGTGFWTTSSTVESLVNIPEAQFVIGAALAGANARHPRWFFNGAIDDMKVYNYSLSEQQVLDEWHAVTSESVCLEALDQADLYPDCRIDLRDLAVLAAQWLDCGLEPQEACP